MTQTTMSIELYGGPGDGIVLAGIPENAKLWILPTPMMTQAEFIALENGGAAPERVLPIMEHIYVWSSVFGRQSSARLFNYSGQRPAKVKG